MKPLRLYLNAALMTGTLLGFSLHSASFACADENAAEACPAITLDDEPAANIDVWNQRKSPACYVYSASYLASVWIRSQWSGVDPSLADYISEPNPTYNQILKSPKADFMLDAENGRTCESAKFIFEQVKAQLDPNVQAKIKTPECVMSGMDYDPATKSYHLQPPTAIEQEMHTHLVNEKKPVGIEYCSNVFFNANNKDIVNREFNAPLTYLNDEKLASKNLGPKCGFHAAVITGQEFRNGACYFRVRNSKGSSVISFNANIDHGYYYIRTNALAANTLRMITLK